MAEQEKERNWAKNVGFATNAAGMVGGPAAIYAAVRSARRNDGGIPRDVGRAVAAKRPNGRVARIVRALDAPNSTKAKVAAGAAGVGMVGLQAANWAGDTIAANELRPSKQKEKAVGKSLRSNDASITDVYVSPRTRSQVTVGKSLTAEPVTKYYDFDPEADRQRRSGMIPGIAAGGAIVAGDQARRYWAPIKRKNDGGIVGVRLKKPKDIKDPKTGVVTGRTKPGRNAAITGAATLSLAALAAGTYKRSQSRKNRPYN